MSAGMNRGRLRSRHAGSRLLNLLAFVVPVVGGSNAKPSAQAADDVPFRRPK
jgi:hypothetical protein